MKNQLNRISRKLKTEGPVRSLFALAKYPFKFKKRRKYNKMLSHADYKDRFAQIYRDNLWSSKEAASGEGSELVYTENLRNELPRLIQKHSIKTIVDAPCGDFNWMRLVLEQVNVEYHGLDIVESVIDSNKSDYSRDGITFGVADICESSLPDCDLLIVRDCLFHLSFNDIDRFLQNIQNVNYKFLLTTTHIVDDSFTNDDIASGDFRLISIFKHPFYFNADIVMEVIQDYPEGYSYKREMILVEKKNVPLALTFHPN